MFRWLHALFPSTPEPPGQFDPALIRGAVERVVSGTDPRLRIVGHYHKKLGPPVARAMDYIHRLVESLPPPVTINPSRFTSDPQLRMLFTSTQQLREILSFGDELNQYRQRLRSGLPADLYAVLRTRRVEKTVLGIGLQGNVIQRDIPQTAVSFQNYHVIFPAGSETKTRREMKKRSFDFLIATALNQLAAVRTSQHQLEQQQRHLLQQKARLLREASVGLQALATASSAPVETPAAIDGRLREVQAELRRLQTGAATLDQHLSQVAAVMEQPEQHLRLERTTLTLDYMNAKTDPTTTNANVVNFDEILMGPEQRITVLLIHFPRNELLPEPDFFAEAQRLLHPGGPSRITTI